MKNYQNYSVTENGAVGYRTSLHPLVDLNFMVSSLRNRKETFVAQEFIKAYYENPTYAVKWLFFLRDIREGLGERRTFRICMKYLAYSQTEVAKAVMELIPEYGRYDDLLLFLDTPLRAEVCRFLKKQLDQDLAAKEEGKSVSLLAKWLPGINTSSAEVRAQARILAKAWNMREREYRKTLSALRAYGNVVEVQMTANRWQDIQYEQIPAKATLRYEEAFERHDLERRKDYLLRVLEGDAKINEKGIMPYEIVHRLMKEQMYGMALKSDLLAELMWEKLTRQGFQNDWGLQNCIVVADGSGSMCRPVDGSTTVCAMEVCDALAIYFAGQLSGVFKDKAITFSSRPQYIDLSRGKNLKEKLEIMLAYQEVDNTNIEAVFDMLLTTALENRIPKEEMPAQLLILSDMEFDAASSPHNWFGRGEQFHKFTPTLFKTIENRYQEAGYKLPRLIFWNLCGRTDTIPKVENEEGVCLLSGFSQNAMKAAAHKELKDPYDSLIALLDTERYAPVEKALKKVG